MNINTQQESIFFKFAALKILYIILSIDVVFFVLHVLKKFVPFIDETLFSITTDNALPEFYQYLKLILIAGIFMLQYARLRDWGYLLWTLLFFYFFLDDAFSFHEIFGEFLSKLFLFPAAFGLRPQDFGELLITALFAGPLLLAIIYRYITANEAFRRVSNDIFILLVALFFFGVIVDMLGILIKLGSKVDFFLSFLEDGGEMIVVSIICWYLLIWYRQKDDISHSLYIDFYKKTVAYYLRLKKQ